MAESLLAMPSPFENETGTLLLLESPTASAVEQNALRARLLDDSYGRPFVVDDGTVRYLYFNVQLMQSAMRLAEPDALELDYTRRMMSFLLFQPRPERIVLIGLGGGSLLKFCRRRLPQARFIAVELDPDVIALGEAFLLPLPGSHLQIIQGDGVAYLDQLARQAQTPKRGAQGSVDVLLVDAFDKIGFARPLASREFLQSAYLSLSGKGVLLINLAGESERYAGLVKEVMAIFDNQVIVLSVPEDGNHILLAFRERHFEPRWRWLHNHAKELRARFGLDFPAFAVQLERSAKLGLARSIAGKLAP